jgi:hypothetical protein
MYVQLMSYVHADALPTYVFLDVIILVLGQEYTSWSFSLHIFLQSPVSSLLLGTNVLKHTYVLCLNLVFTYITYSKWNESSRNPPKPVGFSNPSQAVADCIVITHMEVLHYFLKKLCMNIQICLITAESFTCSQASLGSVVSFFLQWHNERS